MTEKALRHPVLTYLDKDPHGGHSAVDLLQYLLATDAVSEEAVRAAITALSGNAGVEKLCDDDNKLGAKVENLDSNQEGQGSASSSATPDVPVRTRHIALRIYYDGGAYTGLAENVGVANDKSIERSLFAALLKARLVTSREDCGYSRCGRTDKGVSAAGQTVALRIKSAFAPEATLQDPNSQTTLGESTESVKALENKDLPNNSHEKLKVWVAPKKNEKGNKSSVEIVAKDKWVQKEMSEYAYVKILNNLLPPDIRVLGWCPVSASFSARFSCTTRTYRYFFVPRKMVLFRMSQALQLMVGTHDFRNFCKMDVEKVYNFERYVHTAEIITVDSNMCYIQIVGQAFLWHQIRCIAHVLFLVGRGLEEPSIVSELLNVKRHPGKPSYPLADERPLVLHDCQYIYLPVGYSVPTLWNIVCQQEQQWEEFILAAARVRNCINSLQDKPVLVAELSEFCASKLKQREKKKKGANSAQGTNGGVSFMPFSSTTITWREALAWLKGQGLIPDPDKSTEFVYTPLLERSKGTTYDEKVAAVQNSSKRKQKYEDNVINKRKSTEEDAAFYAHMSKQGGYSA